MILKNNKGVIATDILLSTLGILIFTSLISSLMYNNALKNAQIKKEALATLYLTEALENIGVAEYDEIVADNMQSYIPENIEQNNYEMQLVLDEDMELAEDQDEDIIKKVIATISYKVGNKNYNLSMERIKIRE